MLSNSDSQLYSIVQFWLDPASRSATIYLNLHTDKYKLVTHIKKQKLDNKRPLHFVCLVDAKGFVLHDRNLEHVSNIPRTWRLANVNMFK